MPSSSPPATPTASPMPIWTENSRTTIQALPPGCSASSIIPIISAIPTGSLAPDSPWRIVPEQPGGGPVQSDHVMRDERRAGRGGERADGAEQADRQGRVAEAPPADREA